VRQGGRAVRTQSGGQRRGLAGAGADLHIQHGGTWPLMALPSQQRRSTASPAQQGHSGVALRRAQQENATAGDAQQGGTHEMRLMSSSLWSKWRS
jgi:hypothetical protein